jgi:signal transduction histidine kinase
VVAVSLVSLETEHTDIGLLRIENLSSAVLQVRSLANDLESGERGFLLTGDEHYLSPLEHANASLPSQIDSCRSYVKDQPGALRNAIDELISLVNRRSEQAASVLKAQQTQGFAAAVDLAKSDGSEETMNRIRVVAGDLQTRLAYAQSDYMDSQRSLNHWAFISFAVGTVIMIAVMVWLYNQLLTYLHGRDSALGQLQDANGELATLNSELEARVDERTRDLTQANEELQQFAYVASHDLQEPLRTITSFTQLLSSRYMGKLDEDADEFMGYIVTSSRRMTDLINGLLAVVRLRKTGHQTAPVSFETLLHEAEISLQALIRESQTEIEHGALPALVVDRIQFSQVLQNLISNAIKYRREEAPRIRIEAKRDISNWVFAVGDNGRGFNQQFAERIFGLFQRLHGRDVEGTGMGLAIARKIVERHGGRIWAEGKEGVGSTFYFSLPVSLEVSRIATDGDTQFKAAAQAR